MFSTNRPRVVAVVTSIVTATAIVLAATSVQAQITDDEAACRADMSKAFGKYVKALSKVMASCHKLRNKGILPPSDCNDPVIADTKFKAVDALADAFEVLVGPTCAAAPTVLSEFGRCPAPFETIDDFNTPGIDDFGDLYLCLSNHLRALLENTSRTALGLPDASLLPLTKEQQKCHTAIGKGLGKVINATVKERNKCQQGLDKDGGPLSFACATADPKGKIALAIAKAGEGVTKACSVLPIASLADLDSCAGSYFGIQDCALADAGTRAGSGSSALMWELPGECPTSGTYQIGTNPASTDLDTGSPGLVHDMDPILGHGGVRYSISCDADCANCTTLNVGPPADACRCISDNSVTCSTNGDCVGFGGTCQCFYGPPAHYSAGGTPACVQTIIDGPMTGGLAPATGDLSLSIPARIKIFLGNTQFKPCPLCVLGVCTAGARSGLACSIDATDATFGPVSYDCPPSLGQNISGAGRTTTLNFSTGTQSIPFALACDTPFGAFDCPCSTCSGNNSIACNSDAECALAGAGVCRVDNGHGGESRSPNDCSDFVCSPDPNGDPNEGTCLAGPVDKYCDGALRSNGEGILTCLDNADCDVFISECPGGFCGACALDQPRDCFLDPIVAQGEPGQTIIGTGCMAPSTNVSVNYVCGWPGPYRIKQDVITEVFCSDGVTPFELPGGSNCP